MPLSTAILRVAASGVSFSPRGLAQINPCLGTPEDIDRACQSLVVAGRIDTTNAGLFFNRKVTTEINIAVRSEINRRSARKNS